MIGAGGAAAQRQLAQPDPRRHVGRFLVQPAPHRIQGTQPLEQVTAQRRGKGAGQVLVEMVMGVDQSRRHQAAPGIDHPLRRRLPPRRSHRADQAAPDRYPAAADLPPLGVHRHQQFRALHAQVDACIALRLIHSTGTVPPPRTRCQRRWSRPGRSSSPRTIRSVRSARRPASRCAWRPPTSASRRCRAARIFARELFPRQIAWRDGFGFAPDNRGRRRNVPRRGHLDTIPLAQLIARLSAKTAPSPTGKPRQWRVTPTSQFGACEPREKVSVVSPRVYLTSRSVDKALVFEIIGQVAVSRVEKSNARRSRKRKHMWVVRVDYRLKSNLIVRKALRRNKNGLPCSCVISKLAPRTVADFASELASCRIHDTAAPPIQPVANRCRILMCRIGEKPTEPVHINDHAHGFSSGSLEPY